MFLAFVFPEDAVQQAILDIHELLQSHGDRGTEASAVVADVREDQTLDPTREHDARERPSLVARVERVGVGADDIGVAVAGHGVELVRHDVARQLAHLRREGHPTAEDQREGVGLATGALPALQAAHRTKDLHHLDETEENGAVRAALDVLAAAALAREDHGLADRASADRLTQDVEADLLRGQGQPQVVEERVEPVSPHGAHGVHTPHAHDRPDDSLTRGIKDSFHSSLPAVYTAFRVEPTVWSAPKN